jgi:hypothetical protein
MPGVVEDYVVQQKQQQRYDQGYDHLKQKLSNEISHISEITRLDAKETQTAAIRLAGDSNVRLHRRHSEMSIYHDPDFRHGAQQAVRNFVSESREAYKQTQIQTQRMGVG